MHQPVLDILQDIYFFKGKMYLSLRRLLICWEESLLTEIVRKVNFNCTDVEMIKGSLDL